MSRKIVKQFNNGTIDGEIVFNDNHVTVVYNELESYWGTIFFIFPIRKTRQVTRRINSTNGGRTWKSSIDDRTTVDLEDYYLNDQFNEAVDQFTIDDESVYLDPVIDEDVVEAIVIDDGPESTHYELIEPEIVQESPPYSSSSSYESSSSDSYDSDD